MNRALHSFRVGMKPALVVRVYRNGGTMYAAVRKACGDRLRCVNACFLSNEPKGDPVGTIFLRADALNFGTIIHEVVHAMQTHSLTNRFNFFQEGDREAHAHWIADTCEDIAANLLTRGYRWAPKRSRGAIFNLGLNLALTR